MLQYINCEALLHVITSIYKNPSVFIPHYNTRTLSSINFTLLKNSGFKAVIFDKDNTLTAPLKTEYFEKSIHASVRSCREIFGSKNVAICSNTAGSEADKINEYKLAKLIESSLDIGIIYHQKNKPCVTIEEILTHFQKSNNDCINLKPEEIIIVGDRIIGDIFFGNRLGMLTIKTQPLTESSENMSIKFSRYFENMLTRRCEALMFDPPLNKLNECLKNKKVISGE